MALRHTQLKHFARTDLLAGVHGAGMCNVLWMRPFQGGVLEIMHNSYGQYHYKNVATNNGLMYREVFTNTQSDAIHNVPVDTVVTQLVMLMDDLDARWKTQQKGP